MLLDIALAWDPASRRVDLVYSPGSLGGGLALDATPLTPLLVSLGSDRRAASDDILPDTVTEGSLAAGINPRRGWAGDAISETGGQVGSRLWLLEREKQTDEVLIRAQRYGEEALAWLEARENTTVAVATSWPNRTAIRFDVAVGDAALGLVVPR